MLKVISILACGIGFLVPCFGQTVVRETRGTAVISAADGKRDIYTYYPDYDSLSFEAQRQAQLSFRSLTLMNAVTKGQPIVVQPEAQDGNYSSSTMPILDVNELRKLFDANINGNLTKLTIAMVQGGTAGNGFGSTIPDGEAVGDYYKKKGEEYGEETAQIIRQFDEETFKLNFQQRVKVLEAEKAGKPLTEEEIAQWRADMARRKQAHDSLIGEREYYRITVIGGSESVARAFATESDVERLVESSDENGEIVVEDGYVRDSSRDFEKEKEIQANRMLGEKDLTWQKEKGSSDASKPTAKELGIEYTNTVPVMGTTDDSMVTMDWNPILPPRLKDTGPKPWTTVNSPYLIVTKEGDLNITPPNLDGLLTGMTSLTNLEPDSLLKDFETTGGSGGSTTPQQKCKCCSASVIYKEWTETISEGVKEYWYGTLEWIYSSFDDKYARYGTSFTDPRGPKLLWPQGAQNPESIPGATIEWGTSRTPPGDCLNWASYNVSNIPPPASVKNLANDYDLSDPLVYRYTYLTEWKQRIVSIGSGKEIQRRGFVCQNGHDQAKPCGN